MLREMVSHPRSCLFRVRSLSSSSEMRIQRPSTSVRLQRCQSCPLNIMLLVIWSIRSCPTALLVLSSRNALFPRRKDLFLTSDRSLFAPIIPAEQIILGLFSWIDLIITSCSSLAVLPVAFIWSWLKVKVFSTQRKPFVGSSPSEDHLPPSTPTTPRPSTPCPDAHPSLGHSSPKEQVGGVVFGRGWFKL